MTSRRTKDPYEGLKTYCMVEEVDYPIFVRTDGREFRIPEGCMPPAMLCTANGEIRSCSCAETCPDYRGGEE